MGETQIVEKNLVREASYRNDVLKIIALVTMLIDHIGYMFYPSNMDFRTIGRLAFPIFAYQIAIGYSKTSNLKKYVLRLTIFAFITQIPYTIFNPQLKFNPLHFNVLFMFLAAIAVLYLYDIATSKIKFFKENKDYKQLVLGIMLFISTLIMIVLPEVIGFYIESFSFEYGFLGLSMVLVFHIFKENKTGAIIGVALLYLLHGYYWGALYTSARASAGFWGNFCNFKYVWGQINYKNGLLLLQRYYFNARGVFALIPIYMLQGINTGKIRLNKYIAYIFYPAHITVLVVIAILTRGF